MTGFRGCAFAALALAVASAARAAQDAPANPPPGTRSAALEAALDRPGAPDAWALVRAFRASAFEPLVTALASERPDVRRNAALALGELGDARAVEPLAAILKDVKDPARDAAREALVKIGPLAVPVLVRELGPRVPRQDILDAIRRIGPGAAKSLAEALRTASPEARYAIGELLDKMDKRGALPTLIDLLKDKDIGARVSAARFLGGMKGEAKPAVPALIAALDDPQQPVRGAAVEALCAIGDRAAFEPLLDLLSTGNWKTRSGAASVLGSLGDLRAVEPLIAVLKENKDHPSAVAAVLALGRLKDPHAVEPLLALLRETADASLPASAAWALCEIGDKRAIEPLIPLLKGPNPYMVGAAARALAGFKDPRAVGPLIDALGHKDWEARRHVARVLIGVPGPKTTQALIARLKDTRPEVRSTAAESLGRLKDRAAVPALIAAMRDEGPDVRSAAADALGLVKDRAAVPALIAALKDEKSQVRFSAARALIAVPDERAVRPLIAALDDPQLEMNAMYALSAITEQTFGTNRALWLEWWKTHQGDWK